MKILLNELSIRSAPSNFAKTIELLIVDFDLITKISLDRPIFYLGNYENVAQQIFGETNSVLSFALNSADFETRNLLLSFLGTINSLSNVILNQHQEKNSCEIVSYIEEYKSIAGNFAVSFSLKCHPFWNSWKLFFKDLNNLGQTVEIPHLGSDYLSIDQHIQALEKLLLSFALFAVASVPVNETVQTPELPQSFCSDVLINEFKQFIDNAKTPSEKNSIYFLIGSAVARLNGYHNSPRIEKKNNSDKHLRKIFFNRVLERYLSIDFMHGCFEVCGIDGKHLKEITFNGKHLSNAQKDHSINV